MLFLRPGINTLTNIYISGERGGRKRKYRIYVVSVSAEPEVMSCIHVRGMHVGMQEYIAGASPVLPWVLQRE